MIKRVVFHLEKIISFVPFAVWLYSRPYKSIIEREIKLAGIQPGERVLMIGCGAVPFTALWLSRLSGARVTAIDRCPQAARLAARCVRRLGLEGSIDVECHDGCQPKAGDFDAAFIALQAEPKEAIVAGLTTLQTKGRRVVARVASEAFAGQYDALPPALAITDQTFQPMKTFDRSVLLIV